MPSGKGPYAPYGASTVLAGLCAVAFTVRMAAILVFPDYVHLDELQQYAEQAYRAVNGEGLVPWEYRVGARSWLIPALLTPWMALCRLADLSPETMRIGLAAIGAALSLVVVAAAFALGERGARFGGLAAGALVAVWPETVYYSPHILADTVCVAPLAAALAIAYRTVPSTRQLLLGGGLLALAVLLRPQLAPAVVLAGLWIGRLDWRRYGWLAAGAVPAVVLFGFVDLVTWGVPFQSIFRYVRINAAGVAALFGTAPADFYITDQVRIWSLATPLVLLTFAIGAFRAPLVALMALVILATFSAVGHKEGRFLYPMIPLVLICCGIGTAVAIEGLRPGGAHWWRRGRRPALAAGAVWLLACASSAVSPAMRAKVASGMSVERALQLVNADQTVCGLAIHPADQWGALGRARVRRDVGLYEYSGRPAGPRGYDTLLVFEWALKPGERFDGFRRTACFRGGGTLCVYRRPTPCTPGVDRPMTAFFSPALAAILRREGFAVQ